MIDRLLIEQSMLIEPNSSEWFRQRLGKITASRLGCLLLDSGFGNGAVSYALQLAEEIVTGEAQKQYNNFSMSRGNRLEHVAREEFQKRIGKTVHRCGFLMYDEMCGGTPDGIVFEDDATVQIKCYTKEDKHFLHSKTDTIPLPTIRQMHGEMYFANASRAYYVTFHPDFKYPNDLSYNLIEADPYLMRIIPERLEDMKELVNEFVEDMLLDKLFSKG